MRKPWFSVNSTQRYAAKLGKVLKQLLEGEADVFEGGDDFYAQAEAAVIEQFQKSLKGTPEWLVPHDHYQLAISPATRQERQYVLQLYEDSLLRKLCELETTGRATRPQVIFACRPTVKFGDSEAVDDGCVAVSSSASVDFDPVQVTGPPATEHASASPAREPQAPSASRSGSRILRVRWEDDGGTEQELTLEPVSRRNPIIVGRGESVDPRYRMTTSAEISRQHAYFFWEEGSWWIGDGSPGGTPSDNGTYVNGIRLSCGQIQQLSSDDRIGLPDRRAALWIVLDG